jgi:Hemolysins and related proteins containing CBS domains
VLIALNAFFASAEMAMISLNPNKLRKLVEDGDKKAVELLRMVETPSGFLSTIQIGITLAGYLGSAFAAENFSDKLVAWFMKFEFVTAPEKILNTVAVIGITIVLSYLTLVFGELVPKRIAMQKPLEIAKMSAGVIRGVALVMKPVIWLLTVSTNLLLRMLRMKVEAEDETVTEEEIRFMVDVGEESGSIDLDEKEMIENIFELDNKIARDVMTHYKDVAAISLDMTDAEIFDLIAQTEYSRFPVYEGDINNVAGILITKEFLLHRTLNDNTPLAGIVRNPVHFVPETIHIDDLFRDMQSKKQHFAVVVNEYGETKGIVTMEDLIEEIVGNIYDESDTQEDEEPGIEKIADNVWKISGNAPIEDVIDTLEIDEDDIPANRRYDTLGGLVFSQLQTIPEDGTIFDITVSNLNIHIEKFENKRVISAIVSRVG